MNLVYLTALLILGCSAFAYRPGIIVTVRESEFGNLVKGALPLINNATKHFVMDDPIYEDQLTINRIEGSLDDIPIDNINFTFHNDTGIISIAVSKVWHHVKCYAEAHAKLIKSSGTITSADFKGIPNFLIDAIIKIFKSKVLDKLKDSILETLDKKADPMIDKALDHNYPFAVPLTGLDTSLCIALIQKPHFDDQNLYLEIDGTFFNTQKGYARTKDAEEIQLHTDDSFYVDIHVTQYSINSLISAIYNTEIHYKLFGYDLMFQSLDNDGIAQIDIEKITINNFKSVIAISSGHFFARVNSSLDIASAFIVRRHSDGSFWVALDFYDFKFSDFNIDTSFGSNSEINRLVEATIQTFIRFQKNFKTRLPTIELPFHIKIEDIGAYLFDKHIRFGVSIA